MSLSGQHEDGWEQMLCVTSDSSGSCVGSQRSVILLFLVYVFLIYFIFVATATDPHLHGTSAQQFSGAIRTPGLDFRDSWFSMDCNLPPFTGRPPMNWRFLFMGGWDTIENKMLLLS